MEKVVIPSDADWFKQQDDWETWQVQPSGEDEAWLRQVQEGYIGLEKPRVERTIINLHPPREYGDNDPADPNENWDEPNDKPF